MWDLSVTQLGEKLCESLPPSHHHTIPPSASFFQRDGLLTSIRRFSQHWTGPGKRTNDVIPSEMTLKCQSAAADIIHLAHIFLQHLFVFFCSSSRSWSSPPSSVPPGSAVLRCAARQRRTDYNQTVSSPAATNAPLKRTVFSTWYACHVVFPRPVLRLHLTIIYLVFKRRCVVFVHFFYWF